MVKLFDVNLNKKKVYYFTYKYLHNMCRVNSPLIEGDEEKDIEYLSSYCFYTKEPHYLASCMLSLEQRTEVGELMVSEQFNGNVVYQLIESYSRVHTEDV